MPSASAPGNGPRPTAATNRIAQISSEMLRKTLRTPIALLRKIFEWVTELAASKPSGSPTIVASTLPHSAT